MKDLLILQCSKTKPGKEINMKTKYLYSCYLLLLIILISSLCGCKFMKKEKSSSETTLKDIAFDVNKKTDHTVYILENSDYIPYLVLTSDYNGNALLLRKEVLEDDHAYNDYSGYYPDSLIDKYLNTDYLSTLDPGLQDIIVESEISITAKSSLGIAGTDTEDITRKVFLLSYTEIGLFDTSFTAKEGKALKYFEDAQSRIAYYEGMARSWWLRSSYTINDSTVWAVFTKGEVGEGGAYEKSGVRPAFCLKATTLIEEKENVINGEAGYVIIP